MKNTTYAGINYASGAMTNCNPETGIRYGVIHQNKLVEWAFDEIANNGIDQDFEDYTQGIKDGLRSALRDHFSDYKIGTDKTSSLNDAVESAFDAISDGLNYEQPGDCTRYTYEKDGLKFQVASDGDIFVLKSPVFTYAQFCSPCAPGACYLMSPLETPIEANKCYCLPADWFTDDKAPYPVYSIETGELL